MGYINVKFLGQEYQVSEAINEFHEYDEILTPNREKIISTLSQDIKNAPYSWSFGENTPNLVYENAAKYQKIMEDCATALLNKCYNLGVYDVTIDEMLNQTTSISDLIALRDNSIQTMLSEGRKYVELKNAGMERAYRSAASQITGSGWMVFSSSLTTLMINAFVENSIIKSQAKQADREYQKAVQAITSSTTNALDKMVREVMIKQYYPSLIEILMKFPTSLTAVFLAILSERGKFDFDSIQQYNCSKAETMLKSINRVPDKTGFLKQVFLVCPFCLKLYEVCLDEGLLDKDTFITARSFGFGNHITEIIKSYCINNSADYSKIEDLVILYSSITNKSEKEILTIIYNDKIQIVKNHYAKLRLALSSKMELSNWIYKNISKNAIDFCKIERDGIKQLLKNKINYNGISINAFNMLIGKALISYSELTANKFQSANIEEINEYYYSNLKAEVLNYKDKLDVYVNRCLSESKSKKAEYDAKHNAYISRISKYIKEEKRLQQERKNLGLFAFSKKKELDNRISVCISEREKYEKNNDPYKLKEEADKLLNKAKEYI